MNLGFRPRTGDYFFIRLMSSDARIPVYKFPSPYWGFFYQMWMGNLEHDHDLLDVSVPALGIIFLSMRWQLALIPYLQVRFRPRTGDYFFIC